MAQRRDAKGRFASGGGAAGKPAGGKLKPVSAANRGETRWNRLGVGKPGAVKTVLRKKGVAALKAARKRYKPGTEEHKLLSWHIRRGTPGPG